MQKSSAYLDKVMMSPKVLEKMKCSKDSFLWQMTHKWSPISDLSHNMETLILSEREKERKKETQKKEWGRQVKRFDIVCWWSEKIKRAIAIVGKNMNIVHYQILVSSSCVHLYRQKEVVTLKAGFSGSCERGSEAEPTPCYVKRPGVQLVYLGKLG